MPSIFNSITWSLDGGSIAICSRFGSRDLGLKAELAEALASAHYSATGRSSIVLSALELGLTVEGLPLQTSKLKLAAHSQTTVEVELGFCHLELGKLELEARIPNRFSFKKNIFYIFKILIFIYG